MKRELCTVGLNSGPNPTEDKPHVAPNVTWHLRFEEEKELLCNTPFNVYMVIGSGNVFPTGAILCAHCVNLMLRVISIIN